MKKLCSIIFLTMIVSYCFAVEYHVDRSGENLVKFISDAPLEDFEGVTNNIDGYLLWEGEDPAQNSEFHFEVELSTLDTGIGLRNRHMRENYLETDKYPMAQFSGRVKSAQENGDGTYAVQTDGTLTIHGVEQIVAIPVQVSQMNDRLHIQSKFEVDLRDYDIDIPRLMFMKISEVVQLEIDLQMRKVKE